MSETPKAHRPAQFRPDIEGMRTIAIMLVLIYHAGVSWLPGGFIGVDVFFVISGYLITGLLIRELEDTGSISLKRFYARRAKRLLPATAVVMAATALLTWLTVTVVQWRSFGYDIVSAALYVVNWRLADRSVDYLAEDVGVSPVQHFWSLAVEEQFYIVWPLLIVALAWWLRRHQGVRVRPALTVGILAVIIPSLIYSIYLTSTNPAQAFFVTPTRLWELGIGALTAIGTITWTKLPRTTAIVIGWIGLVVVAASGFLITSATAWPGYAALAPTLGTAALIVAGSASGNAGPARLLSTRPAVWVGGLSYSLYLWHWPLLIAAAAYWGELSTRQGLLIVAASFLPAWLCNRYVENPFRFSKAISRSHGLTLSFGANFTAIGAAAGLILVLLVPSTGNGGDGETAVGAGVLGSVQAGSVESLSGVDWFTPQPADAPEDVPAAYADECQQLPGPSEPISCEYGDPEGDITIVVAGDSKILQWESALDAIAKDEGWRVVSFTKSGCGFHQAMEVLGDEPYTSCAEWNEQLLGKVIDLDPDLVVTSQGSAVALSDRSDGKSVDKQPMIDGIVAQWQALDDAEIPVAVILDNPSPDTTVYECVAENTDNLAKCSFDRDEGIARSGATAQQAAAKLVDNATVIDLTDKICPGSTCVPVIGNVLVYRQSSHITDTYARTLTPYLRAALKPVIDKIP